MQCRVTYLSGAGNVFAILPAENVPRTQSTQLATELCNGNLTGITADGVILVKSEGDCVHIDFLNPDGSTGMMCGNGARCAIFYAREYNMLPRTQETIKFILAGTLYTATFDVDSISVHFPPPRRVELAQTLVIEDQILEVAYVDVGSDHVVLKNPRPDILRKNPALWEDMMDLARRIRYHPQFPHGVNVNFYHCMGSTIELITYERGVERITGACGTGALATAIVVWLTQNTTPQFTIIPPSGIALQVRIAAEQTTITGLTLSGPVEVLGSVRVKLPIEK